MPYIIDHTGNIISSNGLLPVWHQAITWTSVDILLVATLGTNFIENVIKNSNILIKEKTYENVGHFDLALVCKKNTNVL